MVKLTYNKERKYLKILRAQLSNQEQVLLLYNWVSEMGSDWENKSNHFFTDYRMIHNVYRDLIIPDLDMKLVLKYNSNPKCKAGKNYETDPLFEFGDPIEKETNLI